VTKVTEGGAAPCHSEFADLRSDQGPHCCSSCALPTSVNLLPSSQVIRPGAIAALSFLGDIGGFDGFLPSSWSSSVLEVGASARNGRLLCSLLPDSRKGERCDFSRSFAGRARVCRMDVGETAGCSATVQLIVGLLHEDATSIMRVIVGRSSSEDGCRVAFRVKGFKRRFHSGLGIDQAM
jgi:hypothetical protein